MSAPEPSSCFRSVTSGCFTLLLAAIALWFAVGIIKSIWPTLVALATAVLLVWLIATGIRAWRANRW